MSSATIIQPEKLLDAHDVAELTGMTTDYIYALARRGAIPAIRLGKYIRFRPSAIADWCERKEAGDE